MDIPLTVLMIALMIQDDDHAGSRGRLAHNITDRHQVEDNA